MTVFFFCQIVNIKSKKKIKIFSNFDSLLKIKHFKLRTELPQWCGVAVFLEKMPICQISFCRLNLRTSHFVAAVFTRLLSRTASGKQLEEKKKNPQGDIFEDEAQLQISPHTDSFSSLLFFFLFCVAGAHYMLWFTLVQLCFHGSCSTNHRVWLFAQRPNSFTSAPFHSSAL